MQQDISWDQLAKYFADELTRKEKKEMQIWITDNPEREQQVRDLYEVWKESGSSFNRLDVDKAWNRLSRDMNKLEQQPQPGNQPFSLVGGAQIRNKATKSRQRGKNIRRLVMTAAAAAVLLVAGLFTYYNYSGTGSEVVKVESRELVAKNGERVTYELSDGSRIILHAGSRLEVPPRFNGDKREVFLEGEAYFEIAHNPAKPFIVHAEYAYTRVLGTKFLVQAWPDKAGEIDVVVSEGRVALGNNQLKERDSEEKEAIITRNQIGRITDIGSNPTVTGNVNVDWYMGWTRGKLTFDNRPLSEIIPKLERWYAIQINTADKQIGEEKLSAEIDYSQPMSEVLKGIALSLDLKLEENDRTFTFYSNIED